MLKYRKLILVGLTTCLALSANVALAAHQLVEEKKGVIQLEPRAAAKDASGEIDFSVTKEGSGTQGDVALTGKIRIEDLANPENVEVLVVDEERDREVSLGRLDKDGELEGRVTVSQDNLKELEAFDEIKVVRRATNGAKDRVLFTAELPHS